MKHISVFIGGALFFCISATTGLMAQNQVTISGNTCTNNSLTADIIGVGVQKVEWRLNGQVIGLKASTRKAVTVAGGNGPGSGSNQLYYPNGVFVDKQDNIWVADASNGRVQKFSPGSTNGVTVGQGLPNAPGFPVNVFVTHDGDVYVADYFAGRVKLLSKDGTKWIDVAGQNNELDLVRGVWVDRSRNVYCTQYGFYFNGQVKLDGMILKYPPNSSNWEIVAGGNGTGSALNQFSIPTSVMLDDSGNIYVADGQNDHGLDNARVMKWVPGASEGTVVAGGNGVGNHKNQCPYPFHAFVRSNGHVFVTNSGGAERVTKWLPGRPDALISAGGNGTGDAPDQFNGPGGIFIKRQYMYVVDIANHRVQRFDLTDPRSESQFMVRHPGTYTAVVTFEDGTTAKSNALTVASCTENITASSGDEVIAKESTDKNAIVYPSPAKNSITISFSANKNGTGSLEMTDRSGRIIMHNEMNMVQGTNNSTVDVSSFSNGIYFMRIIKPDKTREVIQVNKE